MQRSNAPSPLQKLEGWAAHANNRIASKVVGRGIARAKAEAEGEEEAGGEAEAEVGVGVGVMAGVVEADEEVIILFLIHYRLSESQLQG